MVFNQKAYLHEYYLQNRERILLKAQDLQFKKTI